MGQQVNSKSLDHVIAINVNILIFMLVPCLCKMLSFGGPR